MAQDILERIVAAKRAQVDQARRKISEFRLRAAAELRHDLRPFGERLRAPGPDGVNIIAEIKRASPSKGVIAADLDPALLAAEYAAGGAAALSVLTETDFFMGSADDLIRARRACRLPVLRKDFILCPYQVYESAAMGADALLLIVRILPQEELHRLIELSAGLGLTALVEVYSAQDLSAAGRAGARLIGINNRNLSSFETDLDRTLQLLPRLQPEQVAVAASGIRSRAEILRYQERGVFNFLIGESLVRSESPAGFLKMLQGES
ncbi:MAG: indole-3-glycerol phosphate synthase TrpC [Desulfobacterales bacterium]|jgi:indole-3-glycerol phosphate synthase|nr:indole-3-glycerol phosphate synthase TrpC [Desulfobacterales bacterium]